MAALAVPTTGCFSPGGSVLKIPKTATSSKLKKSNCAKCLTDRGLNPTQTDTARGTAGGILHMISNTRLTIKSRGLAWLGQ